MFKKIKHILLITSVFSLCLSCWSPVGPSDPADDPATPEAETADLTVSILLPTGGIEPASSFDINSTITNNGDADAGSSSISYYLSGNSTLETGSDIHIGDYSIAAIASGSSLNHSISYQWSTSGTFYIFAVADSGSTITESDETNNQTSGSLVINAGTKDLSIQSISFSGDNSADGENLSVSLVVENSGTETVAEEFQINYYLSIDSDLTPAGDTDLGTADISTDILPSGTENINSVRLIPDTLNINQYVYLYAVLDSTGTVTETNEGNNSLTADDAAIILIYDNENGSRNYNLIFETFPPTGTVVTPPDTHLYLHDNTAGSPPVWIDDNDNGGAYSAGNYSGLTSALSPGTYYVLVLEYTPGPYALAIRTSGIDFRYFSNDLSTDPYEADDAHTDFIPDFPVSINTGGFINRYIDASDFDWFEIILP